MLCGNEQSRPLTLEALASARREWVLKYSAVTKHGPDRSEPAAVPDGARALFLSFGSWDRGAGGVGGVWGSSYAPRGTECFDIFTTGTSTHTVCTATCARLTVGHGSLTPKELVHGARQGQQQPVGGGLHRWGLPELQPTNSRGCWFSWARLAPGQQQGRTGKAGSTQLAHL